MWKLAPNTGIPEPLWKRRLRHHVNWIVLRPLRQWWWGSRKS